MSSKLAYLSKYGGGASTNDYYDDDTKKKKQKKEKKKKKKHKHHRSDSDDGNNQKRGRVIQSSSIQDMDDMHEFIPGSNENNLGMEEDDGPTVVEGVNNSMSVGIPRDDRQQQQRRGIANNRGGFVPVTNQSTGDDIDDGQRRSNRRVRHDSDSDESVDNKTNHRRHRRRHDSDDDSSDTNANKRRSTSSRKRHDSDSEVEDKKQRRRHDSDSEEDDYDRRRRRRHDSDSDGERVFKHSRKRYDSDDDNVRHNIKSKRRHDSDSKEENGQRKTSRRRRHDSDSESDGDKTRRNGHRVKYSSSRSRRHDDSDSESDHNNNKQLSRRRHDSDSETKKRKHKKSSRRRHDSSSEDDDQSIHTTEKKMSSGHKAGLVAATDFAKAEKKIQKRKREELERSNLGAEKGETVYRDVSGKKRAIAPMQDELQRKREEEEKELQQREANKGAYQKRMEEQLHRELEDAAGMTLARGIEDEQMEQRRMAVIREGDPMAMYAWKKQQEERKSQSLSSNKAGESVPRKQMYKGPPPKPNRYGIRPGYRWDGTDRGNGFEDQVLEALHSKGRKKEEAYKWSAADM